ncbi:histidine kinase dimerization/phosphoacceptor domain-containing protein [Dactylosporangium cerinum]
MDDGAERIGWGRKVRLPAAFTAAQLAAWPLGPLAFGAPVDPVPAGQLTAITLVVGVALSVRAAAPVAVWAVILAAVSCTEPFGLQDQALVVPFADLIALYTVAARRTLRVSVLCAAAATLVSTLVADVLTEADPVAGSFALTAGADAALSAVVYAAVVVFGRSLRRRTARQEAVRVHVARAADHERAAAAHERERLSQELHDVSAHHLTAVVVQLAAAQRLRDPAMTAQALDVARTSGRSAASSCTGSPRSPAAPSPRPRPASPTWSPASPASACASTCTSISRPSAGPPT